jgi:hypothetical protein
MHQRRELLVGLTALLTVGAAYAARLNPQPEPPGRARFAPMRPDSEALIRRVDRALATRDPRLLLQAARELGARRSFIAVKPHGSFETPRRLGPLALLKLAQGYAQGDAALSAEIGHEQMIQHPTVTSDIQCVCNFITLCDPVTKKCEDYSECHCWDE